MREQAMTKRHYTPGPWFFVARADILVALAPETDPDDVQTIWDLLGKEPGVDEVLGAVTRLFGIELTGLPEFAIVDYRGPLRTFLRGNVTISLLGADGRSELSGQNVTTWNERTLSLPEEFGLHTGSEAEPRAPFASAEFATSESVVLAQSLQIELTPAKDRAVSSSRDGAASMDPDALADTQRGGSDDLGEAVESIEGGLGVSLATELLSGRQDEVEEHAHDYSDSQDFAAFEAAESMADDGATRLGNWEDHEAEAEADADADAEGYADAQAEVQLEVPAEAGAHTSNYDHLWDRTIARSVEDAAVRQLEESESSERPVSEFANEATNAEAGSGRPDNAAQPNSTAQPNGPAQPNSTTQPDSTAQPNGARQQDSAASMGAAPDHLDAAPGRGELPLAGPSAAGVMPPALAQSPRTSDASAETDASALIDAVPWARPGAASVVARDVVVDAAPVVDADPVSGAAPAAAPPASAPSASAPSAYAAPRSGAQPFAAQLHAGQSSAAQPHAAQPSTVWPPAARPEDPRTRAASVPGQSVPASGAAGYPGLLPAAPPRPPQVPAPWQQNPGTPAQQGPLRGNVAPAAPQSGAAATGVVPFQEEAGDHDGHTVFRASTGPESPGVVADPPQDLGDGPLVLARTCPQMHVNPPTRTHCASCGMALSGDSAQLPRPSLGRVRLPDGSWLSLERNIVIGRQPSVSRVSGGQMPRLVQIESPGGDISRSHVEIRLEGWNVMLCDLKATNGTILLRPGHAPRRLGQQESALVLSGDVAELAEGVMVHFEDLP